MVVQTDKGLGPGAIEPREYVRYATKRRLRTFRTALKPKFRFRPVRHNLLPHQSRTIGYSKSQSRWPKSQGSMKRKSKVRERWKIQRVWRVNNKKRYDGRWSRLKKKQAIQDSPEPQVWSSSEICFSVGPAPTEHPPKPFARKIPTSRRCRQRYARKREKEKSSALHERIEVDIADLENRRRQIAQSVKEKVKESYGFLPDERRSAKQNALVILTTMEKWFCFCRPTNLAFHDLTIGKVTPRSLQSLLGLGVNF